MDFTLIIAKNVKDINNKILNKRKSIELHQFRELFVQQYNKPLEFQDSCFIECIPLERNCISRSSNSDKYWMNTPIKY